jgi:pyrimidine operon attenuation protein/uracil phosphoribosyltransferase
MIYREDVPSFQDKMNLNRSTAMREIDGKVVILIDFMFQRSHPDTI